MQLPLSSAILITLSTIAASDANKEPDTTIAVPEGLSIEDSQKAVIKAAISRRWTIASKTDAQVTINLAHRAYDPTLNFKIRENQIKLYSDS